MRRFLCVGGVLACVLILSACACPRTPLYEDVPYDPDRTAGAGQIEDKGYCFKTLLPRKKMPRY